VLLIAAALLSRSFWDLFNVRLGFDPENVMAVSLWLPVPDDPTADIDGTPAHEAQFIREILRRGRTHASAALLVVSAAGTPGSVSGLLSKELGMNRTGPILPG